MLQNNNVEPNWLRWFPPKLRNKLVGRQHLYAVIANSGWLLFDKMVRLLLGLAVSAWVARYLGPTQFGQLAYILAYIAFFQAVVTLGADGIIVRDIAKDPAAAPQILGSALLLRLTIGCICWVTAILGMAIYSKGDIQQICMTAVVGGTLIFQAADTIDLWFQSQSQSRRTVVAKLIAYILANAVKVILILCKAPLYAFAAVMLLDTITAAIGLCIAYQCFPTQKRWYAIREQGIQLVRESWPFMLSGLSVIIFMRIDQIMLKEMLGEKELGIYAAALPLSAVWNFIPMTLVASLAPLVAKKKAENHQAYMQMLGKIFRIFAGLGLVVSIPTAIFATSLITILYGNEFSQSADVLKIHVLSNIFINLGVAQGLWLINEKKGIISLYRTITGVVVSITGNLILIPRYGLTGSTFVTVLSWFCSSVASNFIFAPTIFKLQVLSLLQLKSKNIFD